MELTCILPELKDTSGRLLQSSQHRCKSNLEICFCGSGKNSTYSVKVGRTVNSCFFLKIQFHVIARSVQHTLLNLPLFLPLLKVQ